jgi:hypothetical protein
MCGVFREDADEFCAEGALAPSAPGMMPKRWPSASGMMERRSCLVSPAEKAIIASRTSGMQTS